MKKGIAFCLCLVALAFGCRQQPMVNSASGLQAPARQKELAAIRGVLKAQQEAWNRADVETYMQGYWQNDSLAFVGKTGLTYGWNQTLANYRKSFPDAGTMGKLTFTILKNELLSPELAYTVGKWHIARAGGPIQGHFSLLWKKINGTWVIVSDHSS